jgi:hypothetical protein
MGWFDFLKNKSNKIVDESNYTTAEQGNWTNAPLEKAKPVPQTIEEQQKAREIADLEAQRYSATGGKSKQYKTYKKHRYVVHIGKKGGHYIMVKGEKVYI